MKTKPEMTMHSLYERFTDTRYIDNERSLPYYEFRAKGDPKGPWRRNRSEALFDYIRQTEQSLSDAWETIKEGDRELKRMKYDLMEWHRLARICREFNVSLSRCGNVLMKPKSKYGAKSR